MKLKRFAIITGLLFASVSLPLHAADLMQVYYKALVSDPTFKRANSDWESAKQNLPIARAAYLTQVAFTTSAQRQYANIAPALAFPNPNGYNYLFQYNLSVSQPLFNLPAWNAIKTARAQVKAATATYASAGQDLMLRTVRAYIAVLQAYDQLRFQLANKRSIYEQLVVAEQQFKVGLIAITGVYDARARYDQAVAQSIQDQNSLLDRVEELAEITGVHYSRVKGISKRVPLLTPKPNNINTWTQVATRQNYGLMAQTYTMLAARQTIKQQATSWLPQFSLAGAMSGNRTTKLGTGSFNESTLLGSGIPAITTTNVAYGLSVDFPLIQGGAVIANTRQAEYNFLSASNERERIYRSVISDTRQSFLGIITGISKINADKASVVSAENALNATKAGYEVGTRNMVDVLNDVTALYQTQQQYADDQYSYVLDTVDLKFNAGTLCVRDLEIINSWFKKRIHLKLGKAALKALESKLPPIQKFPQMPNVHRKLNNKHKLAAHTRHKKFKQAKQKPIKKHVALRKHKKRHTLKKQHVLKVSKAKKVYWHSRVSLPALPMPMQTQPMRKKTHNVHRAKSKAAVAIKKANIKPRYAASVKRKPTLKAHKRAKVMTIKASAKQKRPVVVSLDQKVLPLYDTPPRGDNALPPPV